MAVLTPGQQIDAPPDELSTTVGGPLHRMPRQSAPTVSELSTRLYAAYQVPSGSVRLAGCALEQRPIVHVAGKCEMANGQEANRRIEVFVLESGEELDAATVAELGLNDCVGATKPTQFSRELVDHFVEQARWALNERSRAMGVSLDAASVEVEILWCRHASGKLRFMIDEQAVDLPFADWAVRLQPPPFICPETSVPTFQIAATDDGRIVAAEEIATCEQSGRRMLRRETVVCGVTGRRVSAELAEKCPVTEQHVLREQMTVCPVCTMSVSPAAIINDRCRACAAMGPVKKADPRMCLVLGEHPGLDRWRRWSMAETPQAYVLEARSLWQLLLVVVDKQTLEVRRVARRNRLQSTWTDVPPEGWREFLQ